MSANNFILKSSKVLFSLQMYFSLRIQTDLPVLHGFLVWISCKKLDLHAVPSSASSYLSHCSTNFLNTSAYYSQKFSKSFFQFVSSRCFFL